MDESEIYKPTMKFDIGADGLTSVTKINDDLTEIEILDYPKKNIDTKELYSESSEIRPELAKSFELLNEGLQNLDKAINKINEGDLISSDDFIHRLQAILPELFCCRSISDGFGAIINAVFHSISNMQGKMLNEPQLHGLKNILNRINTEPFMQYEEAVDEIINLEDLGFDVDPTYIKYVTDLLDE